MNFRTLALGAALLLTAGCTILQVQTNQPLPENAQGQPDFAANYGIGSFMRERFSGTAQWTAARSDTLILLAFSGGGKRSSAFAHGALRGLRDIAVRPEGSAGWRMLDNVDYISGVSGGSFPAAHYGLYRERHFPQEFLNQDINARIAGMYLLPWNWNWMVNPNAGTNDHMATVYDQLMFRGATHADLQRQGPPLISVNATDIVNGVSFQFVGNVFGTLCSDLNSFPIARAVAASNGFPVLFSPITLENHAARCRGVRPPTVAAVTAPFAQSPDTVSRQAELARIARIYADPEQTRFVHLMDGGIADNLALRGVLNMIVAIGTTADLYRDVARHTRRILVLSVDGQAANDRSLAQQPRVGGIRRIVSAVSGTQIDAYNFETIALTTEQVAGLAQGFRQERCRQARVIDGHPCADVEGRFVHVSLSDIEDAAIRERLQSIPTGLTIPADDVRVLVEYGERLVRNHPVLRTIAAATGEFSAPGATRAALASRAPSPPAR